MTMYDSALPVLTVVLFSSYSDNSSRSHDVPFLSTRRTPSVKRSDQACLLLDLVQIQQADGFESEKAQAAQRETIVFTSRPLVTDALVDFAKDPKHLAGDVSF
jgi:hypothetical protein